ncbi:MAG: glycosyltransferase family 2 protein [Lentisphaeria bacterium]
MIEPSNMPLHLVVSMPALNEAATVGDTIRRLPRELPGVGRMTVLVVDDGSTDATVAEAKAAGALVVSHGRRHGVGAAFQTGLAKALELGADLLVTIDADGQFDPATIPQLIAPVTAGTADFATASRFADPALVPEMPASKRWGNHAMSYLISTLAGERFYDVSCGMRCYNRHAAMSLNVIGDFTYTQEVFLNLAHKGLRIAEVPIRVRGVRAHGKSRVASNLFRYAFKTSWIIFRCLRDYKPMRLFGTLGAVCGVIAAALLLFLLTHFLQTGAFSPHKWTGFTGGAFLLLAFFFFALGLIGDMLNRQRLYLESLLYLARRQVARGER